MFRKIEFTKNLEHHERVRESWKLLPAGSVRKESSKIES